MIRALVYSLISLSLASLLSLVGIFFLGLKVNRLKTILVYLISFSAGALFADAFLHLIPEAAKRFTSAFYPLWIITGILLFFFLEKVILWNHCHLPITKKHIHHLALMNLIGEGLHNFLDGLVIFSGFVVSTPVGLATSIAVFLHEIPQEIGDFGILVYGKLKPKTALFANFLISLTSFLGLLFGFLLFSIVERTEPIILLIAAGGFIYIAGSDLIPELHKQENKITSLKQIFFFILGVIIISLLLLID
jgi:zinc and cadmium transporter